MTSPLYVRELSESEQAALNKWLDSDDRERARRAEVILKSAGGKTAAEIGLELGFHPDNLKKWIRRFNQEGISGIEVLKRGPRSRFGEEEIEAILGLYNRSPEELGLSFSVWTPQKLAIAAIRAGIVSQISHVTVRQILGNAVADNGSDLAQEPDPEEDIEAALPDGETPSGMLSGLSSISGHNREQSNLERLNREQMSIADLVAAGQNALRRGENGDAVEIFQGLLSRSELMPDLAAQVRCRLSEAYEGLSNYDETLAAVVSYEDAALRNQLSPKFQARTKLRLGWAFCRLANYAKAIARFNEARPLFIELGDQEGIGSTHYALGYVYIEINEFDLARGYLLKALDNLRRSSNAELLARIYINLGMICYEEGDYAGAKGSYLKAQEYAQGLTDQSLLALILMNLASVYVKYGKRDEANQYFERAIKELTRGGQKSHLARAYNNLGNNQMEGGKWAEAAESLSRALTLARELGDRENTWLTLITLGELHFRMGDYERAEAELTSSLELLAEGDGDKWAQVNARRLIGLLYIAAKRSDKALQMLRSALQLATRLGNLYEVCLSHLALAEYHFSHKGYEQAEEYMELAKENLKDRGKRDPDLIAHGLAQRMDGKIALARRRFEEAKQHISASINIFASINNKYELAASRLEMGLLNMHVGDALASREYLTDARDRFSELGARPVLDRAEELLAALQRGELPKTSTTAEVTLTKDILLMQRLIDAATSRDLLLKELSTIIYENYSVIRVVVFDGDNPSEMETAVVLGCRQSEAAELKPRVAEAIGFGKTSLGTASLYPLEDRLKTKVWLYIEPKIGGLFDLSRLKPLFKQTEMGLENCSLRALSRSTLTHDIDKVRAQMLIPGFIYASSAMYDVVERIKKIRTSNTTVLITGESGTGKELIARAIHAESARRDAIFLPFNCTATPKELIDSQLFGHRRGAFTGATSNYQGIIRAAEGGTLFLDEIGDLSLESQPKLLRFLEAGEIQPVGEAKPIKVDVRVLAATNAELERAVQEGRFREDLHYRLNIIRIHVPPLRERKEEIPPLANHYLQHFAARSGRKELSISEDALLMMSKYYWPGNIRQLRNEIERLIAYSVDNTVIAPSDLSPEVTSFVAAPSSHPIEPKRVFAAAAPTYNAPAYNAPAGLAPAPSYSSRRLKDATDQLERRLIEETLLRTQYNVSRASRELGLSRRGLRLKMLQFGLIDQE